MANYYDGYEPEDEDARRRRREEESTPYQPSEPAGSWWERSGIDDTDGVRGNGMGSPESGYGPGGVDNPAYGKSNAQRDVFDNGTVYNPAPPPTPNQRDDGRPTFLPATPSSYRPPEAQSIAQPVSAPAITNQLTKILQDRLSALSQPFDVASDDTYKKTVSAYGLGQERDARRQRAMTAERAAAGGYGSSGVFDTKIRGIAERRGQNESMFAAQTAADRLRQRDEQLVVAIQLARQVGQDDLASQLEQQRLRLSEELGRGDLALRRDLGVGNLGLGYDRLGFDYTNLAQSANRDAILAILGENG